MESYYNATIDGLGIEGFMNWANTSVDGWFSTMFIFFIWLGTLYVGSKSRWKIAGVLAFSFLLSLISAMILRLFTIVNKLVIIIAIFGLAASVFWMVIEK